MAIATSEVSRDTEARVKELLDKFQIMGTPQSPKFSDMAQALKTEEISLDALSLRPGYLDTTSHRSKAGESSTHFLLHSNPGPFAACSHQPDEKQIRGYSTISSTGLPNLPSGLTQSRSRQMDEPSRSPDPGAVGSRVQRRENVVETYSNIGSWLSTFGDR